MNKKPTIKTAFSFLEASMVIVIVGFLIMGITIGRNIVDSAKLTRARVLTQTSVVSGIKDLVYWVETTSTKSFPTEDPDDQSTISTWYDINPQSTSKNNATAASAPTYSRYAINKLPGLVFNGTSNYFTLPSPSFLPIGTSARTLIFVTDAGSSSTQTLFSYGFNATGQRINVRTNSTRFSIAVNGNEYGSSSLTNVGGNIYVITFPGNTNSNQFSFFKNGVSITPSDIAGSSTTVNTGTGFAYIGSNETLSAFHPGTIGEIIIFSRSISTFERQQIELYLSKKWNITLT